MGDDDEPGAVAGREQVRSQLLRRPPRRQELDVLVAQLDELGGRRDLEQVGVGLRWRGQEGRPGVGVEGDEDVRGDRLGDEVDDRVPAGSQRGPDRPDVEPESMGRQDAVAEVPGQVEVVRRCLPLVEPGRGRAGRPPCLDAALVQPDATGDEMVENQPARLVITELSDEKGLDRKSVV